MQLSVKHIPSIKLEDSVVRKLLNLYPEERLLERKVFDDGLNGRPIEFKAFKEECVRIQIPWQLFLLNEAALAADLEHVDSKRQKISAKLLAKRKGRGQITSRRIIDRLVRCQNFLLEHGTFPKNSFCGALIGLSVQDAAEKIRVHFKIDPDAFRKKTKENALAYLVDKFEDGNINVCQGVLTNTMLPQVGQVRNVYKNTSGFAIKDDKIPFVFIPSEINPEERDGRQIYTLAYLIALIGLSEYGYSLDKDLKSTLLAKGPEKKIHDIASEFLMPRDYTNPLRGAAVTAATRDALSTTHKITPTAVAVILYKRGHFASEKEFKALLPQTQPPQTGRRFNGAPAIQTSVKKFNGRHTFEVINAGLKSGSVRAVQAQHIIFGVVNKKKFKKYRKTI